jgi:hypothetical protein
MIGLPRQTYSSVMQDASYLRGLVKDFGNRLVPFISPLAPFVDPGSKAFENPELYGYKLSCQTLEEHRRLLRRPSWKYMLNYETQWMSKDEIVMSTYDAGIAFNQFKMELGLITPRVAKGVEARARGAIKLMHTIDLIVSEHGFDTNKVNSLKSEADELSNSSICLKKEMNWPAASFMRNAPRILWAFTTGGDYRYGA